MAEPAVFQTFFKDQPQPFAETVMEGCGRGMVIDPFLVPIFFDHGEIKVPVRNAGFPAIEGLAGLIADGKRGKAGRTAETFLRCAEGHVDSPAVDVERDAAQGGDAIDQKKGAVTVNDLGHPRKRLKRAGRCLGMDQSHQFDRFVLGEDGFDFGRSEHAAPGLFNPLHIGAVKLRHFAHPLAEITVAADHDRIARFDEIAEGGFHSGAARSRHRKGQRILGLKNGPEQGLLFVHQREPFRIEISYQCGAHRAQHTGVNGAGAGAEQQTLRYIQVIDRECHDYPLFFIRDI